MLSTKSKAYMALCATSIIWGTTWVAMKYAIHTIPPFTVAAIRHLISGCGFVLFFIFIKKEKLPTALQFKRLLFLGILTFVMANAISTLSLKYISSGLGALIGALYPLCVVIIEYFFCNNKNINATTFTGITIGLTGIVLVFYNNAFGVKSSHYLLGIVLALIAMLSWSFASVLISKKFIKMNTYYSTGWQMLIACVVCTSISFIYEKPLGITNISATSIYGLLYLIVAGSFIAMACFVYTMHHLKPAIAVLYAYINPIIAMLLGWVLLNEKLTTLIIIGSCITLLGVYLVNKSFKKKKELEEEVNPVFEG